MKNRLTRIKSPIRKKIRNTSPFRYIIRNKSPQLSPPNLSFRCIMRNTSPLKYILRNISPPNVNIADQIPLQVKIRNTRFRSDLVGNFNANRVFSVFFKLILERLSGRISWNIFLRKSVFSVFFKLILDIRVSVRIS